MNKMGYIYSLADPDTGNVRYIGKTIYPNRRLADHLKMKSRTITHKEKWVNSILKLGKIPVFEVLLEVPENILNQCEIELIKHYKQFCKLTNGTDGGDGTSKPASTKQIEIMINHNPMKNPETVRKASITRNRNGRLRKPVNQYTKTGVLIKEWPSVIDASKKLDIPDSNISRNCNNKGYKSAGGFVWKYKTSAS